MTGVVFYTDHRVAPDLAAVVRYYLLRATEGLPLVSVSQQPMDLGTNRCLGPLERSHLSMYRQMLAGAEALDTEFIALAEHDVMYLPEHFHWTPPDDRTFYYNVHHWFLQWDGKHRGLYSYFRRRVLSMLIAGREVFLQACREKVWMLEHGWMIKKGVAGACEPGALPSEEQMVQALPCEPGVCDDRVEYLAALARFKDLGKECGRWEARAFRTGHPMLDIRHQTNFSGGRRGRQGCRVLPPWGTIDEVIDATRRSPGADPGALAAPAGDAGRGLVSRPRPGDTVGVCAAVAPGRTACGVHVDRPGVDPLGEPPETARSL